MQSTSKTRPFAVPQAADIYPPLYGGLQGLGIWVRVNVSRVGIYD